MAAAMGAPFVSHEFCPSGRKTVNGDRGTMRKILLHLKYRLQ